MATVIGVRFKKAGKVYYFDPTDVWPKPGDAVIVETARGMEYGEVVTAARTVEDDQIVAPLKKVVRLATEEDARRAEFNIQREKTAFTMCQEKILKHNLDMKLVSVEYTFDNSKIIFYFTASGRVDFRELVKDLAAVFKMRIELRQIGVRDEAKMLGGLGSCGRPICCGAFLGDFQPVSIKMAKEQNLSLNPTKISGQCGRLMCCLKYEQDNYELMLKKLPKIGRDVSTPEGIGVLTEINVIRERVKVRMHQNDDTFVMKEFSADDVHAPTQDELAAYRERNHTRERADAERTAAEETEGGEETKKRFPRPKPDKRLNTEQFIEQIQDDGEEVEDAPVEKRRGKDNAHFKKNRKKGDGYKRAPKENAEPELQNREDETDYIVQSEVFDLDQN